MPTVLDRLNAALLQAFNENERVVLLGEDVLDPYGGAFRVTRGLSTAFPERVLTTPISEAGIAGLGIGMALRGMRPVVEIMFGDFITLIADQVVNHAAKFRWMYADKVNVPLVIRTPMGGWRGYGPTHSQSLEKLLLGVPGLRVLAPTSLGDPGQLLLEAIFQPEGPGCGPILFIENKLLYYLPVGNPESLDEFEVHEIPASGKSFPAPIYQLSIQGAPPAALTIAAYGYMAETARKVITRLAYEDEIFAELIIPTQLSPFELEPVFASAHRTGRLLAAEEGSLTLGWGAEVLARSAESLGSKIKAVARVAAKELPIPSAGPLEAVVLPGEETLLQAARQLVRQSGI